MFLPHFDILCDLLLDRCTTPCNLFVLCNKELPCIGLTRGKFELTNQDSVGGKNSSVLSDVEKGIEIRQLFSLKIALNIHEKGFTTSKTKLVGKK